MKITRHITSTHSLASIVICIAALSTLSIGFPLDTHADPRPIVLTPEPPSERYNGTYLGIETGPSFNLTEQQSGDTAVGYGGELTTRVSFILQLVDLALSYRFSRHEQAARENSQTSVDVHGVALAIRFHPLFMSIIHGKLFTHVLSSVYVQTALSAEFVEGQQSGNSTFAPGLGLGSGFDVPLGNPDAAWSVWLGFRYAHTWLHLGPDDWDGPTSLDNDTFSVVLSFRHHNLRLARVAKPTELGLRP